MRVARCAFVIALVAAALGPAGAEDALPPLLERIYLEQTGFGVWVDGPRVEGLGPVLIEDVEISGRQLTDDTRVRGWGGGLDGRLGVGVAEGWALELGGSYLRVDQHDHDSLDPGSDGALVVPLIDGLAALGYLALGGPRIQQDVDATLDLFDARLGVARDVTVYAEGFSGQARLGLVGGRLEQGYRIDHRPTAFRAVAPQAGSGWHRLEEDLDSWFLGPYLGLSLAGKLTDRLRLTLDADLALLYSRAELDASQRLVGLAIELPSGNFFCGALALDPCHIRQSDEENGFSARPRVRLGLDFDFGPFVLGATGGVTYWSYAPQIVNPQIESIAGGATRGLGAAHVSGDDLFLADVGVHLTVPLGARGEDALPSLIDNLYLEQTGHAVWLSGPRVKGLGTTLVENTGPVFPLASRQLSDDGRIEGVGGGWDGRLGVAVGDGLDVELGGSFFRVDQSDSDALTLAPDADEALLFPLIDGLAALGYVVDDAPGPARVRQGFEGKVDLYDARLAVARKLKLASRLHAQLRLGLMGGRLEQDYRIDHRTTVFFATDPTAGSISNDIEEDLDSWFVGPYLGVSLVGEITRRLHVTLDADLGLLYHRAELDASQHFVGPVIDGFDNPVCGTFVSGQCQIDVTDREDHFTGRPRARLSVDFDLGPLILGVTGGFTWWSYVPQVVNPQFERVELGTGFNVPGAGAAHVGGDDMLMADVGLRLVIPFGR